MNAKQMSGQWSQIVAKAWADETFKKRLLADPAGVLMGHGMIVPAGVEVRVVENTDQVRYLTLPVRPTGETGGALNEEELARVAGGINNNESIHD